MIERVVVAVLGEPVSGENPPPDCGGSAMAYGLPALRRAITHPRSLLNRENTGNFCEF